MIYALNYEIVCCLMLSGIGLWSFLWRQMKWRERLWKILNAFMCLIALYLVLKYTVLYRVPSNNRQFMIFAPYSSEFYREMLMNVILFYPLGLTLTILIGPWSIVVAFVLSFIIEVWQYVAGTGVTQGSDVLMNTLGCVVGAVPYFIRCVWRKIEKNKKSN